jgi:very-short-patch-repair endonuclease
MINERGNLVKENIQITKELLDFCLEAGYFIDLKTGDYSTENTPMIRNLSYNRDLVYPVWKMYTEGVMFPGKYYKIFKFRLTQFLTSTFKYCGFKTLTRNELLALYKDDINTLTKETWIENLGVDNPAKCKVLKEKAVAKAKETLKTGIPQAKQRETYKLNHPDSRQTHILVQKSKYSNDRYENLVMYEDALREDPNNEELKNEVREFLHENYRTTQARVNAQRLGVYKKLSSSYETRVQQILDSHNIRYKRHFRNKKFLNESGNMFELDFKLLDHNIAIEVDGLYFHSTKFKDPEYHVNKRLRCAENGVHLVSFTSKEIDENLDLVESKILEAINTPLEAEFLKNLKREDLHVSVIEVEPGYFYYDSGVIINKQ